MRVGALRSINWSNWSRPSERVGSQGRGLPRPEGGPPVIGLEDIRTNALALPEVSQGTHFRLPSYKVADKGFITIERSQTSAILSVDQTTAEAAAAEHPDVCEVVWRQHGERQIHVGVRVHLEKVSEKLAQELILQAWRNKAPKRLVAAHGQGG